MWRWFPQLGTYKQCCVEYPFTQWQVPSIGQTPRSATTWEEGKSGPIPWPKVFKMKWSPWIISEAPVITTFVIPQPNLRWPPPTHTHTKPHSSSLRIPQITVKINVFHQTWTPSLLAAFVSQGMRHFPVINTNEIEIQPGQPQDVVF